MGAAPSTPTLDVAPLTPRLGAAGAPPSPSAAEQMFAALVGEKAYPISSEFWNQLLELPLTLQWPRDRVLQACHAFAENNYKTKHLAKILIHLVCCLQECTSTTSVSSVVYQRAINAAYISSIFLKFIIENAKTDSWQELCLDIDRSEKGLEKIPAENTVEYFLMRGVLDYIGSVDVSPELCYLHHELLNLMLVLMSTQLCSGPSPEPKDVHPFIDAAMLQDSSIVASVVQKLLLNFVTRPKIPLNASHPVFSDDGRPGVLQRVGSAAANFVLLPYYYLVSSTPEGATSQLADNSLLVLLIMIHYRKCISTNESIPTNNVYTMDSNTNDKDAPVFHDNPYCKALNSAKDIQYDRADVEGNAQDRPVVRLSFASLFDAFGRCLNDESSVLLLYSLVYGNCDFQEYVLVRTDLDTLLMPILEMLYNASRKTSNQIYMLLIILLILSQDSTFNASVHQLVLPAVPWYHERLMHQTSLGSLMVVILIRTIKYNLSKLKDVYLHTNCLAILANMAPHVHRLSAYASQRLVSLFDMLSRKYAKLAELKNDKSLKVIYDQMEADIADDMSIELHIYTDFLRIVLEIIIAILTYALPRNPEVVYAVLHRQEVFEPFKNHPRFSELLENIYTVLDFFNSRMDMQQLDGEWSVDKVLEVINKTCRSWRGEGMKMFTQLRFTYEQESHPEEFFIPYAWRLVLSRGFSFNPDAINLFPVEIHLEFWKLWSQPKFFSVNRVPAGSRSG
ncbi:dyggve-melchior-clausen syndrome protein [Zea mays]|uniref:Dymeclin n=1 Tax=Zea mays TaxID=4577 RepID=A0A1D6GAK5_MAIZE|nr:dyggve-melchior-clausen syndrome protein [Zea mays]